MTATAPRVLVIWKRSALDLYVRRHRMARVSELLRRKDPTVARLERADRDHAKTVEELHRAVESLGVRASFRPRDHLGSVEGFDLVVCAGGDGTLLAASHHVGATPVLGVNTAPRDSVGYLCGARLGGVRKALSDALEGRGARATVTRLRVWVEDRVVHQRVLNEALFCHPNPAMTSRYLLTLRGRTEEHKSSGVYLATAVGSTAAIRGAGGKVLPLRSRRLQFAAREPYDPDQILRATRGVLRAGDTLVLHNKMRQARLYIDGPRTVVPVQMGERVRVDAEGEPLVLLGLSGRAR